MHVLMLTALSYGIYLGAQLYLFCMNVTESHSYSCDVSSSPEWH